MKLYTICQSAWRYLTIAVSDEFDPNTLDAHQLLEDEEIWFDEDDPTIEESQSAEPVEMWEGTWLDNAGQPCEKEDLEEINAQLAQAAAEGKVG